MTFSIVTLSPLWISSFLFHAVSEEDDTHPCGGALAMGLGLCVFNMLPDDAELMGLDLTLKAIFLGMRLLKLEDGDQNM